MTAKSDFDQSQWDLIAEGPVTAGMIVLTSQGGGTFRETFAMSRAYADARQKHGQSELLDEIVSSRPEFDRHRYHSPQELHDAGLERIAEAAALVQRSATADEAAAYRDFVIEVAQRVAAAHKEDGQAVSQAEQAALDAVRARLEGAATA